MQIQLNGQRQEIEEKMSLAQLLDGLSLPGKHFAIEVNEQLVPRTIYNEHSLGEGDCVEIVTLVGGG